LRPDFAEAHFNLGYVLCNKGDLVGAVGEYREAIGLKSDFAAAHFGLGCVLVEKGDLVGAESELREAIGLRPDFAVTHNNLGYVLRLKGDLEGAIGSFSNVPSSSEFYGDAQKQIAECKSRLEPKKGLWDKFTGLFTKK